MMKWRFGSQSGQAGQAGEGKVQIVGDEGELYFHPFKRASIVSPMAMMGKEKTIPIFPYSSVLVPGGTEWVHIFEMRHRQMIYEVGDGLFGFCYFNQQQQKLALVGTLARIKSRRLMEDGRTFVVMEGVERFYLKQVTSEKPYFKAKVQTFSDYTENVELLDRLERDIFDDVRFNVRLMDLLFPLKNYTLSAGILENRPLVETAGKRLVNMADPEADMARRTRFSFAVMDMLQISSATKLLLLQDHVLEKRYAKFRRVLDKGSAYLRKELVDKGVLTAEGLDELRREVAGDVSDLETTMSANWIPENYVDGQWQLAPTFF
jgi:Lon protease-like protein